VKKAIHIKEEVRERALAYWRKYNLEHREKRRANAHRYYIENRETCREKCRKWQTENRERLLAWRRKRYRENFAKNQQRFADYERKRNQSSKIEVMFSKYSNGTGKCVKCGEGDIDVLCLDHIADNGAAHRLEIGGHRGQQLYKMLKKQKYPEGYQVLCANCNLKKELIRKRSLCDERRRTPGQFRKTPDKIEPI